MCKGNSPYRVWLIAHVSHGVSYGLTDNIVFLFLFSGEWWLLCVSIFGPSTFECWPRPLSVHCRLSVWHCVYYIQFYYYYCYFFFFAYCRLKVASWYVDTFKCLKFLSEYFNMRPHASEYCYIKEDGCDGLLTPSYFLHISLKLCREDLICIISFLWGVHWSEVWWTSKPRNLCTATHFVLGIGNWWMIMLGTESHWNCAQRNARNAACHTI